MTTSILKAFLAVLAAVTLAGCGKDAGIGNVPAGGTSCGSGSITVTFGGQTITFACYGATFSNIDSTGELIFSSIDTTRQTELSISVVADLAVFRSGATFPLGAGLGKAILEVAAKDSSAELIAGSGSITLDQWPMSSGDPIGITIPSGTMLSGKRMSTPISGTISGTATTTLTFVH